MAKKRRYSEPIRYWSLGMPYLRLVEGCCGQIVAAGNHLRDATARAGIDVVEYDDELLWSDHGVGIPVLFSFYHGIELLLKGFIALRSPVPATHKLTDLVAQVADRHRDSEFIRLVEDEALGLGPRASIRRFLQQNDLTIDAWYEALRYPESKTGQVFDHLDLRYGGLALWESLGRAAKELQDAADDLAASTGLT